MEKTFREILSEFFAEKQQKTAHRPNTPPYDVGFLWQGPRPTASSLNRYPKKARVTPTLAPAPPPPEPVIPLAELKECERLICRDWIELGASELKHGLSLKRLKQAYRRLAKRLHPDAMGPEADAASFVKLNEAYGKLRAVL